MRNVFRVVAGDKEYVAHNNIKSAFTHWLNGYAYAAYIAVMSDGHRLDKRAELVTYNTDIWKGELYATYRININENEFPYSVTSIGFAPYSGAELSNVCNITFPASSVMIYGTVYLERGGSIGFYLGDNPLVRSLLGMTSCGELGIRGSSDMIDNFDVKVDTSRYLNVAVSSSSSKNERSLTFNSLSYSDFLIMSGNTPCARYDLAYDNTRERTRTIQSDMGFFVFNAVSISKATRNGENIDFGSYPGVSGLLDPGVNISVDFSGYEFFSDPLYKYVGLKNGSDYYLIDSETLTVSYQGQYRGELMLCSDGNVIMIDRGEIIFVNQSKKDDVLSGQTVVLYRDGSYDIFVYDEKDETMCIYRYDGGIYPLLLLDAPPNGTLHRLNDFAVVVSSPTGKAVYTVNGVSDYKFELDNLWDEDIADGCYYGDGYMGSCLNLTKVYCDKAYGRFCLTDGVLRYVGEGGIHILGNFSDIDGAAVGGNAVFILQGGQLKCYRLKSNGVYVSTQSLGNVQITEKYLETPSNRTVKIKIQN